MPKDLTKETVPLGNVMYEWWVQEYEKYSRSRRWYVVATLLGVGLVVYALFTENYLFALVIMLFAIVLYLHEMQEPLAVYFAITETGIILGRRYYRFSELAGFWVIYNPPEVKNLYFTLNSVVKHRLQIPLLDYDPRPVRDFLKQYLVEEVEKEEEPVSDRLARIFKLH